MRSRRIPRAPAALLACLAVALLFPHALGGARTTLAGRLVPVAEASTAADEAAQWREAYARRTYEVIRLRQERDAVQERAAVPADLEGLRQVEVVPSAAAATGAVVLARVLDRGSGSAVRRTFLVDAGRSSGVVPGLPVLQGNSLVGIVGTVSDGYARVLRVDDISPSCRFPALILPGGREEDAAGRDDGLCQGTADGRLLVSFLAKGQAAAGDLVVTGPGRHPVPEGLVLGVVERFGDDDRDGEWQAVVRPLRDLDRLSSVCVLLTPAVDPEVRAK